MDVGKAQRATYHALQAQKLLVKHRSAHLNGNQEESLGYLSQAADHLNESLNSMPKAMLSDKWSSGSSVEGKVQQAQWEPETSLEGNIHKTLQATLDAYKNHVEDKIGLTKKVLSSGLMGDRGYGPESKTSAAIPEGYDFGKKSSGVNVLDTSLIPRPSETLSPRKIKSSGSQETPATIPTSGHELTGEEFPEGLTFGWGKMPKRPEHVLTPSAHIKNLGKVSSHWFTDHPGTTMAMFRNSDAAKDPYKYMEDNNIFTETGKNEVKRDASGNVSSSDVNDDKADEMARNLGLKRPKLAVSEAIREAAANTLKMKNPDIPKEQKENLWGVGDVQVGGPSGVLIGLLPKVPEEKQQFTLKEVTRVNTQNKEVNSADKEMAAPAKASKNEAFTDAHDGARA
jgi:hypothetical protein